MDKAITRGRAMYSRWSKVWLCELLSVITAVELDVKSLMERFTYRERLLEMLGMALEVLMTGDHQDKVADPKAKKSELFEACKRLYIIGGEQLKGIEQHFTDDRGIDWQKAGHYSVDIEKSPQGGITVKVTWNKYNKTIDVDKHVISDDTGPFVLKRNWSVTGAFLASPCDEYCCKHFFPGPHRKLARMNSSDMQIISLCTGGDGTGFKSLPSFRPRNMSLGASRAAGSEQGTPRPAPARRRRWRVWHRWNSWTRIRLART